MILRSIHFMSEIFPYVAVYMAFLFFFPAIFESSVSFLYVEWSNVFIKFDKPV